MKLRLLSAVLLVSLLTLSFAAGGGSAERSVVPDHVRQQAMTLGAARVIVRLNTPFTLDAEMKGGAHAAVQRQNIATTREFVKQGLKSYKHQIAREYDALPFLAVEAGPDALQMLEAMKGVVVSVHEDALDRVALAESGPVVQAPQAWAVGADGTGSIVAILDTGVLKTHPFLTGRVIAEACFSTTYAPYGATSACPGGVPTSTAAGSGLPCPSTFEGCDHGTHVAGIVAGGTTGTLGSGIAPGAKIIAVQVFSKFPAWFCGGVACVASFTSDQLGALNHVFAIRNNFPGQTISSINMSLGGGQQLSNCDSDDRKAPIDLLRTAGIATVIASGNDGYTSAISAPGCISTAVSVGSTNDGSNGTILDQVSYFSNSASFLSILAPGMWINSSVPTWSDPSGFANFAGTSMATPHVAGAFAILRQVAPAASVTTLLSTLQSTGTPVLDTRNFITKPRIEVNDAVVALAKPDLAVTALSAPPTKVTPGTNVSINYTVRNLFVASNESVVGFYLSADATITTGDVFLGQATVPALAAGSTSSGTIALTIPPGTPAGTFFLGAIADITDTTVESDETNNARVSASFQVVRPDLTVSAITAPTPVATGQSFLVSTTVKNNSTIVGAPASTMSLYLASTPTLPLSGGELLLGTRDIPALLVSGTSTGTTGVTIPANQSAGIYYIVGVADSADAVLETVESNNAKATTGISVVQPDVAVTAATTASAASPGGVIAVSNTVKNNTTAPVGPFSVGFYLSSDPSFDGGDVFLTSRFVSGLTAGALSTVSTNVTIPGNTSPAAGYRIIVRADDGNALLESNEINNTLATGAINVVRADLIVPIVTAPAAAAGGQTISVSNTVKNNAIAPGTAVASTAALYLATNNDPGGALGVLLGTRPVPLLAGLALSTVATPVTLPGNTSVGTYYIKVVADSGGTVTETNEGNNVGVSGAVVVGQDVTVTTATTVAAAAPGQTIAVSSTVKNGGTVSVGPFTVGFYLSADSAWDVGDVFLGNRTVPGPFLPAALNTASTNVQIPGGTAPGTWRIIVRADDALALAEGNETNNTRATGPINIVRGDLIVPTVAAPPAAAAGQTISVSNTVKNNAPVPGTAIASQAALYLADNNDLGGTLGVLLGTRPVPLLAGLTLSTVATPVTIPGNTSIGTYYIKVVADSGDAVTESAEGNNIGVSGMLVVGPDVTVTAATTVAAAAPGQTIALTNTVKNGGTVSVGTFTVGFYLSTDTVLDFTDVFLGNRTVTGSFAPAALSTATTNLTIPGGTAPGTWRIIVFADHTDVLDEGNETNNTRATGPINIVRGDLIVPTVTAPPAAAAGQTISVSNTVKNNAPVPGTAVASQAALYLADNNDPGGTLGVLLRTRPVPLLAGLTLSTVATPVTLPANTSIGTYYVKVVADSGGAVTESNEGNNIGVSGTLVVGPDVTVTAATTVAAASPGLTIPVSSTVRNSGTVAVGTFSVGFYLSPDSAFDITDVFLGNRTVTGSFLAAALSTASTNVTIPGDTPPGTWRIIVLADRTDVLAEGNETNNTLATGPINIVRADLIVPTVTAPPAAAGGQTISVSNTVKNNAPVPGTAVASTAALYLADNNDPGGALGVFLATRPVPLLAGLTLSTVATPVTLPANTSIGTYYVKVVADTAGTVTESNEGNNVGVSGTLVVGPDVTVTAATTVAAASPGQTIAVSSTVKNSGTVSVGTFSVGFYLSTDGVLDIGDAFLGSRTVTGPFLPAALNTASINVTIPGYTLPAAGYRIIVFADHTYVVGEGNEGNNMLPTGAINIVRADLIVPTVTAPVAAGAGQTISVSNTVKNNTPAPGTAVASTAALYLADNNDLGGALGTLLGTRPVPLLAGLGISTVATPVTIPGNTSVGAYYIKVVADSGDAVTESNESNNIGVSGAIGVGADLTISALTVPAFGVAERTIGIANTVKNNASIADVGSPFSVGLYLSDDNSITLGVDPLLANRTVPSLVHLGVSPSTTPITLPSGQGNYYIGGVADDGSVIGETNESNNALVKPIGVVIEMARSELGLLEIDLTNCTDPYDEGHVTEYFDFSIAASSQTNAAPTRWTGSAVYDDGVSRDTFSLPGTVDVNGNVTGTFTFTLRYLGTAYAGGNGTFSGTTTLNSFNVTVTGHFTSGETCTFTGTFDQL